jgi:hypothetical protein
MLVSPYVAPVRKYACRLGRGPQGRGAHGDGAEKGQSLRNFVFSAPQR